MTVTVRVHPANLLSANHRTHWAVKAHRTRAVRRLAHYAANGLRGMHAAHLTVTVHPPDNRRRDAHNTLPTIKAAIDGLIDARLLPDDSDQHLRSLRIEAGAIAERGWWVFDIELREVTA